MHEELMTVKMIARRLLCSVAHCYALIEAGELSCYKIGLGRQGGVRVSEEQLQEYLEKKKVGSERLTLKHIKI
jgi:excisionase family DNA binding protein